MHSGYIHNFYHNKQGIIDDMFYQYNLTLFKDIDQTALIQEWKKSFDAAAYERNINQEIKLLSKKKEINCHGSMTYLPKRIKRVIQ